MAKPTIHLNGTSRELLFEGYLVASNAVGDAIAALGRIEFNSRDYYPQGPSAWKAAVLEHSSRLERLAAVKQELMDLAEHCQEA
jgi:hypothetical protein